MGNSDKKWDVVIPILNKDFDKFKYNIEMFCSFLPVKRFVLIGDAELENNAAGMNRTDVVFINEKELIDPDEIKQKLKERVVDFSAFKKNPMLRFGWYYQQFLKMAYAFVCEDDYYLIWDADTVPIKKYEPFSNDSKAYFDVKTEYHIPYFDTMNRMFDGELVRVGAYSFISEHMIVNCSIMRELILKMSEATYTNKTMALFSKKVFECVDDDNLLKSGFSEFETFGTYCMRYYSDEYAIREWHSLREANRYFVHQKFSNNECIWLEDSYDAVSFEKFIKGNFICRSICHSRNIQKKQSFYKAKGMADRADKYLGFPLRICDRIARKIEYIKKKK